MSTSRAVAVTAVVVRGNSSAGRVCVAALNAAEDRGSANEDQHGSQGKVRRPVASVE